MHFTYIGLLNIDTDIDIAIFCKYRIDIVSKLTKCYRNITNTNPESGPRFQDLRWDPIHPN